MKIEFNGELARKYSIGEAIFIEYIYKQMKENKKYKITRNGDYWIHGPLKMFKVAFPFWSRCQIERIIKKLKEKEVIKTAVLNDAPFDRSVSYILPEEIYKMVDDLEKGGDF